MEGKVYVDINVFVYWLGGHPEFGEKAYRWVKKIEESPRGRFVTSTLTIYQVLVVLAGVTGKSLKDRELVGIVVSSIRSLAGLTIEPLTGEDLLQASELMEVYGLDFEDAVHLAVAMRCGAGQIVSNDRDFDRTPLRRLF